MKLGVHKCKKVTQPNFSQKKGFPRFWAKRGQNGPKTAKPHVREKSRSQVQTGQNRARIGPKFTFLLLIRKPFDIFL